LNGAKTSAVKTQWRIRPTILAIKWYMICFNKIARLSGPSIDDLGGNQCNDVHPTEWPTPKIRWDRARNSCLASVSDIRRYQSLLIAAAKPVDLDVLGYAD
jgi:hypothetical protein